MPLDNNPHDLNQWAGQLLPDWLAADLALASTTRCWFRRLARIIHKLEDMAGMDAAATALLENYSE